MERRYQCTNCTFWFLVFMVYLTPVLLHFNVLAQRNQDNKQIKRCEQIQDLGFSTGLDQDCVLMIFNGFKKKNDKQVHVHVVLPVPCCNTSRNADPGRAEGNSLSVAQSHALYSCYVQHSSSWYIYINEYNIYMYILQTIWYIFLIQKGSNKNLPMYFFF